MPPKRLYIRKKKEKSTPAIAGEGAGLEGAIEMMTNMKYKVASEIYNTKKTLVIVESPSKCKKITDFLGADNYKVVATKGHIYEIEGLSAIDRTTFEPKYTILPHQRETIKLLGREIFMAKEVILATDDDREGEAIAYHVALQFGLSVENTPRIVFHEITRPAILHAVENPRRICMELVYAQQSRAILDVIVGFKVSPVLWRYIPKSAISDGPGSKNKSSDVLSAGRCQSVALRLIYENYLEGLEAAKNIGEPFYKIHGYFFSKNIQFELDGVIFNSANEIRAFMEKSREFQHMYLYEESQKSRASTSAAPLPLNTSVLIQTCSNILHISPHQTMQICQKLYQNGYITYMRTDARKFAAPFIADAKKYIAGRWGDNYLRADFSKITAGGGGGAKAAAPGESHEAIRPTHIEWFELPADFEGRDKSVYGIIRNYTLASCMADAKLQSRTIHITAPDNHLYKHSISHPTFAGWKAAMSPGQDGDGSPAAGGAHLFFESMAKKNTLVSYNSIKTSAAVKYTHSHYSEAALVKKLEEKGIGRPSTFSMLVDVIQKRGYVKRADVDGIRVSCREFLIESGGKGVSEITAAEKVFGHENKKLVIEPIGITAIEFLLRHFEEFFNYEYTAKMELELDLIASSGCTATKKRLCSDCYKRLGQVIKAIKQSSDKDYKIDENHVLTFTFRGPVIKYLAAAPGGEAPAPDGSDAPPPPAPVKYKNIKSGMEINIEKLERGEYKLDDLLEIKNDCLGMYEGEPLFIKIGKYGAYAEWGTNRTSLKNIGKHPDKITMGDIVAFLQTANENTRSSPNVIRIVTADISIRKGRFGPYIFYQTRDMENPKFVSIPKKYVKEITAYPADTMEKYVLERVAADLAKQNPAAPSPVAPSL